LTGIPGYLAPSNERGIDLKTAIISDIHGNLEALSEVLADIDRRGVDRTVCLGDNVGYGPDPEEVVRLIREREIPSVMGNHEISFTSPEYFEWFNTLAQVSLVLTKRNLSPESMEYCQNLPHFLEMDGFRLVHGCPPDQVLTYVIELSDLELGIVLGQMNPALCFIGHTHLLQRFTLEDGEVVLHPLEEGFVQLPAGQAHLVNVGSVGQPRDGNNNAKYVIWDGDSRVLEVRHVPYDVSVTAKKIIDRGWPEAHARRLW
jgi:predicted phosphodiesterase